MQSRAVHKGRLNFNRNVGLVANFINAANRVSKKNA